MGLERLKMRGGRKTSRVSRGVSKIGLEKVLLVCVCALVLLCLGLGPAAGENIFQLQWAYKTVDEVRVIAISENGHYLAAGAGGTLYFFVRENHEPLWSFQTGSIQAISMTPDARFIAVGTSSRIYLFDNKGNKLWDRLLYEEWQGEIETYINDVAISTDGNYVAAVGAYSVNLFSADGRRLWYSYGNPNDPISTTTVAISGDGGLIAVGDRYGVLSLFKSDGKRLGSLKVSPGGYGVEDVAVSKDGQYVVAVTYDKVVLVRSDGSTVWSFDLPSGNLVDMTPDASRILVSDFDAGVYSFTTTGRSPQWQNSQTIGANSIAVSPDGAFVAVGTNTGVYMLNGTTGAVLGSYSTEDIVEAVDVSKGGYVAAGLFTKQVLLFSSNTPPELSNPQLSPIAGDENTEFTYRVTYKDADGDAPQYVRVNIDEAKYHDMKKVSGEYTTGAVFEFTTTLPVGSHAYFFEAKDNRGATVRLPKTSVYAGPVVAERGEGPSGGTPGGGGVPVAPIAGGIVGLAVVVLLLKKLLAGGR